MPSQGSPARLQRLLPMADTKDRALERRNFTYEMAMLRLCGRPVEAHKLAQMHPRPSTPQPECARYTGALSSAFEPTPPQAFTPLIKSSSYGYVGPLTRAFEQNSYSQSDTEHYAGALTPALEQVLLRASTPHFLSRHTSSPSSWGSR